MPHRSQTSDVFRIYPSDGHPFLELVNEDDWRLLNGILYGTKPLSAWTSFHVQLNKDPEYVNAEASLSDFPELGGLNTFSAHAVQALEPILSANGHLLPLTSTDAEYFGFLPTTIVDALDESRSELWTLESGEIVDIKNHVFHAKRLLDATIFRLPQKRNGPTYATSTFAETVTAKGLRGFEFQLVWRSEDAQSF